MKWIDKIRNALTFTTHAPRTCMIWSIVLVVVVVFFAIDGCNNNLKTAGPDLTLESDALMRQRFDNDTIIQTLRAGETVRVIAINASSFGQGWLVESASKERGWVDASDLPNIKQVIVDGKDKGEEVNVEDVWLGSHIHRYKYTNSAGEEKKLSTKDFEPVYDAFANLKYDAYEPGMCSTTKFEKKTIGKHYDEVTKMWKEPQLVHYTADGMVAQYGWKVWNPQDGKTYYANVKFDKEKKAVAVEYRFRTDRAASWLKHMPLAKVIIDMPLTTVLIRKSAYVAWHDRSVPKALAWIVVILYLGLAYLWLFATQTLPTRIMGWLIMYPWSFKPIDDKPLRIIIAVVGLVCWYVWCIIAMAWGMFPFWFVLITFMSIRAHSFAISVLWDSIPHDRCQKCRNVYSMELVKKEFEYDEIVKGTDIVQGNRLGSRTETWKTTWIHVTRSDGHSYDKDFKDHKRRIDTYEYIDYEVTYRLDHYRLHYKCNKCGYPEEDTCVEWTELDRREVGTHVDTEVTYLD